MPRINISEIDNTTTFSEQQISNVVYIPGFSISDNTDAYTPVLLTTVKELQTAFGSNAAVFGVDQAYNTTKFPANAIPSSGIQFAAGSIDLSYKMAYDLLSNDIPVVYERVNELIEDKVINPSTALSMGFIASTSAPTNQTEPTDPDFIGEIYVQYAEDTGGSGGYIDTFYRYDGTATVQSATTYVWTNVTDIYTMKVTVRDSTTGEPTVIKRFAISAAEAYNYLSTRFEYSVDNPLWDKNAFNLKYVTTGAFPIFEYDSNAIVNDMLALANPSGGRGDCIALIDHTNNVDRVLAGEGSVFYSINKSYKIRSNFAAMYTPWVLFGTNAMPGSYAYLISMASAVQTNPNWLAIAGVNRAVVPGATGLSTNKRMTRAIADSYMTFAELDSGTNYSTFINPITSVRPYGLTVWGNRTLADTIANTEEALYYLNMRSLIAEIKKKCYAAAEQLMFEQNSDVLWINFKSKILPLLDEMASSYGISGYKIIKQPSDNGVQLKALIKVFPIYAVEDFDITIMLTSEEVIVEE